jgi:hypothetical protein
MYKVSIYTGLFIGMFLLLGGGFLIVAKQTTAFIPGVDNRLVGGFFALYGAFRLWRAYLGYKQMNRPDGENE